MASELEDATIGLLCEPKTVSAVEFVKIFRRAQAFLREAQDD